ncbi:hypothetical protein C0Q70_02975 [Pomacea canaliculata]|uniref:Uncharacterized protein n=1 Tax=Pomacea canaliculata TaxID=400727 RepID=A0A2T7PRG4_POMCA|nr:hypothetical protein C0Q70_02975 [Pomacea canaliculata]
MCADTGYKAVSLTVIVRKVARRPDRLLEPARCGQCSRGTLQLQPIGLTSEGIICDPDHIFDVSPDIRGFSDWSVPRQSTGWRFFVKGQNFSLQNNQWM